MPPDAKRFPISQTTEPLVAEMQPLQSPASLPEENTGKTELKKELGLTESCAIIIGIVIGSGIFISPKGVLENTGSVGLSLVVWILCGIFSLIGALCYAELGTFIPKSGGDYAYIHESFGNLPAFLFLWDANLIFVPTTNAIISLTFANYVIQPFFDDCDLPESSIRLIAAVTICFLTFLNCWNVRATTKIQDVFMFTKIGALCIIIVAGFITMFKGYTQNFENAFEGSTRIPGEIAASFYSGIFSFAGWNYLNFMTEELKDPFRNLPRAIYISLPLVTVIYVLVNIAYLAVLSPVEMLASNAIAVTFANKVLGSLSWIMPLLVALSAFGGLSVHIMTCSRLGFVGARQGHFPEFLAMINVNCNTPVPSLIFLGILSLGYLCTTDVYLLIEYASFVESLFIMITVLGMVYLRIKYPHKERPIKIHIIIPIIFLFICAFLVFLPIYVRPFEVGMGLAITASGIPAYFLFIHLEKKPKLFQKISNSITRTVQCLTSSVRGDKDD